MPGSTPLLLMERSSVPPSSKSRIARARYPSASAYASDELCAPVSPEVNKSRRKERKPPLCSGKLLFTPASLSKHLRLRSVSVCRVQSRRLIVRRRRGALLRGFRQLCSRSLLDVAAFAPTFLSYDFEPTLSIRVAPGRWAGFTARS